MEPCVPHFFVNFIEPFIYLKFLNVDISINNFLIFPKTVALFFTDGIKYSWVDSPFGEKWKYFLKINRVLFIHMQHLITQSQWKQRNNAWNLFKVNTQYTRKSSFHVALVSIWLTLDRFYELFSCFHCWLWTRKCRLGYMMYKENFKRL